MAPRTGLLWGQGAGPARRKGRAPAGPQVQWWGSHKPHPYKGSHSPSHVKVLRVGIRPNADPLLRGSDLALRDEPVSHEAVRHSKKHSPPCRLKQRKSIFRYREAPRNLRGAVKTMETRLEAGKLQNALSCTLPLTSGRLPARLQHRLLFS